MKIVFGFPIWNILMLLVLQYDCLIKNYVYLILRVEIERRVHLTKNDEEVDHETGNGEDILPGTDIDIRKREGGVEAEIDTARGATGVDPGTAAGHRTSIGERRVLSTMFVI